MAVLGSRLLEPEKREAETVEAIALRQAGEESVLGAIARAVSQSLTDVLRWAVWWSTPVSRPGEIATPEWLPQDSVLFTLNQDFGTHGISARDLQAMVASWQAGAFSHDTLFEVLRKGEILPDGRTNEQERKLLTQDER